VTFTAHLATLTGWPLYKPGKVNRPPRDYGYDLTYQVTKDFTGQGMITAIDKTYYPYLPSFADGTYIVIHDPTELRHELLAHLKRFRIITIRKTVHDLLEAQGFPSIFLYHPFLWYTSPIVDGEKHAAVSISRIDFDKHTDIILEANKTLSQPVQIYGQANGRYIYHKLDKAEFDKYYKGAFPKRFDAVFRILKDAKFVVDMSVIKKDGGGTQYTFLEAIANDCALILNRGWIVEGGDFVEGVNCLAVSDGEELVRVLSSDIDVSEIKKNARALLERHTIQKWKELASELPTHT
jgi:hypothetical protein